MSSAIDIVADLNAQDDEGLCWTTLSSAVDPSLIAPGAVSIAGNVQARARVRVVTVDDDGQVHLEILRGPANRGGDLQTAPDVTSPLTRRGSGVRVLSAHGSLPKLQRLRR
jgi:hypothetical protein